MKKIIIILSFLFAYSSIANAQIEEQAFIKLDDPLLMDHENVHEYAIEYAAWLDKNSIICTTDDVDNATKAYAHRLETILSAVSEIRNFNVDVRALYKNQQGITTYPDGSIRISSSLMDSLTDDQILAIVACELYRSLQKSNLETFRQAISQIESAKNESAEADPLNRLTNEQLERLDNLYKNVIPSSMESVDVSADSYAYDLIERIGKDPRLVASTLTAISKMQFNSEDIRQTTLSVLDLENRLQKLEDKYIDGLNRQAIL